MKIINIEYTTHYPIEDYMPNKTHDTLIVELTGRNTYTFYNYGGRGRDLFLDLMAKGAKFDTDGEGYLTVRVESMISNVFYL